jgi:RNA polymerase-interacting CarD/CdnL/TRCF family regulator
MHVSRCPVATQQRLQQTGINQVAERKQLAHVDKALQQMQQQQQQVTMCPAAT